MDIPSSWPQARFAAGTVQSEPRSPISSVHSASYTSEIENDVPLLRYERGEASGHAMRSNSVSSYEEDRQLALLPVLVKLLFYLFIFYWSVFAELFSLDMISHSKIEHL